MRNAPTTDITHLQKLLSWRLLAGSHPFPGGPAGGTCILEAAIVVAGRPYREVRGSSDAPEDFCPVMAEWLLKLNDQLTYAPRQRLICIVPMLASSAGSKGIEEARHAFIVEETRARIQPTARYSFGWKREMPSGKFDRLAWAESAATVCWPERTPTAASLAVLDHVLAIGEEAFAIGKADAVDPLTALVRLERIRPREPRIATKVV